MTQVQEYALHIVSKHKEASEAIKEHIQRKLTKLEKFTDRIVDIHVNCEVQKLNHNVRIGMKFSHFRVQTHATTLDLYQSIDKAIEKLQRKLSKWKSKIQHHHTKEPKMVSMPVDIYEGTEKYLEDINDAIEEETQERVESMMAPPKVVKEKKRNLKMLTNDEALMKLELSMDNFLVFRSEEDQKLKVAYRRRDNSYGLLQPE